MYSLHLTLLLSIPQLPFLTAEYRLRAKAPAPTTAPLFARQEGFVCPIEQTSCNNGSPGCCSYGESCTFNENHVPVCLGPCNDISTCSGIFDGLCCNLGYTCNYQATICESDTMIFSTMPLTGIPSHNPSPIAAAPSFSPSPIAAPPSILPTPQAAPPPPATPGTSPAYQPPTLATMPPETQSSAMDSSSLSQVASSLAAAATKSESSRYSYGLPSDFFSVVSVYSYPAPTIIDTPPSTPISLETMPTAVQPATVNATVNTNSGANSSALDTSNVIVRNLTDEQNYTMKLRLAVN